MDTPNPYESTKTAHLQLNAKPAAGSMRIRLGVLAFNSILLGLFPPTCCPCGLGPIGFIIQPYMFLLGLPSIFLPIALPQLRTGNELTFLSIYVTNYIVMSYGLGVLVDRTRQCRRPNGGANHAIQRSGRGDPGPHQQSRQ